MTNFFDEFDPQTPSALMPTASPNFFDKFDEARQSRPDETPGMLETFARGAVQGATFGFDDELGLTDEKRREAGRQANPWTHFAGEVVGSIVPMVAAGPVGAAARGAATAQRVGSTVANSVARGTRAVESVLVPGRVDTLGQAVRQGAKLGAVQGALSGAGNADVRDSDSFGEGLYRRATGAAAGAATGAVVGPVLGAAAYGAGRFVQSVAGARQAAKAETADLTEGSLRTLSRSLERDRINPDDLIAQIRQQFPDDTATAGARRRWGPVNGRQDWTPDLINEVVRRANAGEDAAAISAALRATGTGPGRQSVQTLLDEMAARNPGPLNITDRAGLVRSGSGDNTQMTLRAAAATPGEARGVAREALIERQIGSMGRLQQAFSRLVGSVDYDGVAARHSGDLRQAGEAAYNAAFKAEQPFDLNPVISAWMSRFGGQRGPVPEAVQSAIDSIMIDVPIRNQVTGAIVGKELRPPKTLEQFINARQNIAAAIEKTRDQPSVQRQLIQLRDDLSNVVRQRNPEWGRANDIWRDGKAAEDMLEAGARMSTRLNTRTREGLEEFQAAVTAERRAMQAKDTAGATAARVRQELFRVGLVRALNDQLSNVQATADLTRTLRLPGARSMMEQILGRDRAVQLFRVVDAEHAMHRTYGSQFGSQTTPLKEAIDDLNWAPRFKSSLNPMDWIGMAGEYAASRLNAARNARLMPMMTETDPLQQIRLLERMRTLAKQQQQAAQQYITPAVAAAGPVSGATVAEQNANWSKNYGYRPRWVDQARR